jgi:hypothetical protein
VRRAGVTEEIGLKLDAGRRSGSCASKRARRPATSLSGCIAAQSEGPFTLHPDEIERGDWFAPEEITRWVGERPREFARAFQLIWGLVVNGKHSAPEKNLNRGLTVLACRINKQHNLTGNNHV